MPKIRSYKKGEPFRDASFLIVVCEGAVREKIYFETLAKGNQQIKIQVVSPEGNEKGNSAPHWLLERAINITEELGSNRYDNLWFVLDVDKWKRASLEQIKAECQSNWSVALSNPCFEIWLIMHYIDQSLIDSISCRQLKGELNKKVIGGYKVEIALLNIQNAIKRAKDSDSTKHFIPALKTTKVYLLADQIINK
jgi:hypothetical protein